jgi:hypothetical protein
MWPLPGRRTRHRGIVRGIAVDTWVLLLLFVVLLAVAAAALVRYVMRSRRRTSALRRRFGGEYERTVERAASKREAESDLESRLERRARLDLRGIDDVDRQRYEEQWRDVEALYDRSPVPAVAKADALVAEVLANLGYPMEGFNERIALLSVDYPDAVEHYRRAHATLRSTDDGNAASEDLYEGIQHYRALLDELVGPRGAEEVASTRT